jgi:hypothetical protein
MTLTQMRPPAGLGNGREMVEFISLHAVSSISALRARLMIEEIASAYLSEADGNASLALRRAIDDALADLSEMERLVSRGYAGGYVRRRAARRASEVAK